MKLLLRLLLLIGFVLTAFYLYFYVSSLIYWHVNQNKFVSNISGLNDLIREEGENGSRREFQLDDSGGLTEVRSTRIFDADGAVIGEFYPNKHLVISERDIPPVLAYAVVAMEDRRFYKHHGVDLRGILRALISNLVHGRVMMGGSTITQQLAKVLFTSAERTLSRKFFDMKAAREIEKRFSKKEILAMYLNTVYFGHGAYGVESASRFYFNKRAISLNDAEAAMLAGLLSRPNVISPYMNPDLTRSKQRVALQRMARAGYLRKDSIERVQKEFWRTYAEKFNTPYSPLWQMKIDRDPYFNEYAEHKLVEMLGADYLYANPVNVYLTCRIAEQEMLRSVIAGYLRGLGGEKEGMQVAVLAMDPSTGAVRAMVGGASHNLKNQLNRCLAMKRQIGSLVKPFLYATAIEEEGMTPETVMTDRPLRFRFNSRTWSPENYDGSYAGAVTLADALRMSKNSIAVQLLQGLGVQAFTARLKAIWGDSAVRPASANFSLALGAIELSPLQVAQGYSVLADSGKQVQPLLISRITDPTDKLLYDFSAAETAEEPGAGGIFKPETAGMVTAMLKGVLREGGTAAEAARKEGFTGEAACKTGTTSDTKDAWFAIYDSGLVLVVWVGYDDNQTTLAGGGPILAAPLGLRLWRMMR